MDIDIIQEAPADTKFKDGDLCIPKSVQKEFDKMNKVGVSTAGDYTVKPAPLSEGLKVWFKKIYLASIMKIRHQGTLLNLWRLAL